MAVNVSLFRTEERRRFIGGDLPDKNFTHSTKDIKFTQCSSADNDATTGKVHTKSKSKKISKRVVGKSVCGNAGKKVTKMCVKSAAPVVGGKLKKVWSLRDWKLLKFRIGDFEYASRPNVPGKYLVHLITNRVHWLRSTDTTSFHSYCSSFYEPSEPYSQTT